MTKHISDATHVPIYERGLTLEDRVTHRKWVRACCIVYATAMVALAVAAGLFARQYPDAQTARQGRTLGVDALPAEAHHPFG